MVITGQLMYLDSAGGHPAPPKNRIFLKHVAWRLIFCPEKVDFSGKGDQFVASARGEVDLLNVKKHQIKGAAKHPELHQLVERNHAADEPAFHLLLETTLKPSQRDIVQPVWKKVQKQQLQSFPQR